MRDDVDGDEAMVPRVPNLLLDPSARQIAEHELTGAVYRSLCRHCVASKGRAHAHSSREEGELPELGIDYGFFGRDREDVLPILCVKCRNSSTRCIGATIVDRKGASDHASSFLTAFIKRREDKTRRERKRERKRDREREEREEREKRDTGEMCYWKTN